MDQVEEQAAAEAVEIVRTCANPRYAAYETRKRWGYEHPITEAVYSALDALSPQTLGTHAGVEGSTQ